MAHAVSARASELRVSGSPLPEYSCKLDHSTVPFGDPYLVLFVIRDLSIYSICLFHISIR
jgi:hypothetical protein